MRSSVIASIHRCRSLVIRDATLCRLNTPLLRHPGNAVNTEPNVPLPTTVPGATLGSPYFQVVVALFVTSLITANLVAVKVLEFGPWVTGGGHSTSSASRTAMKMPRIRRWGAP